MSPQSWILYFYCFSEAQFRAVPSLLAAGKPVIAGTAPKEEAVVGVAEQKQAKHLPSAGRELTGANPVASIIPTVLGQGGVAIWNRWKGLSVAANDTATVHVRDGRYDIYFQYSDDPDGLYQGDSFTLSGNGVEIQLVKVVGGNYGIRKVK